MTAKPQFVAESGKRTPVVMDVDVVVAGAGISGMFAALASARMGARTVLIDRFGSLGGNIGPGMVVAGGISNEAGYTLPGGLAGIPKEFVERMEAMLGDLPRNYASISSAISYLASKMMDEAKAKLILSACAADPIVRKGVVEGLFVETASGRIAVKAKVTVDATGDAALAARAGAPMIHRTDAKDSFAPIVRPPYLDKRFKKYDEGGLYALIAGVDHAPFTEFKRRKVELSDEMKKWAEENGYRWFWASWMPALRASWENGEFRIRRQIAPGIETSVSGDPEVKEDGHCALQVGVRGDLCERDWRQISLIEKSLRDLLFDYMTWLRKHIVGMEKAYITAVAPFLGFRGGPHIDAEHTLTVEECIAGARFDDVLFVNIHEAVHGGAKEGYDVPYRMLLPKKLDGMLVTGRGAGYVRRGHDPSGLRARPSMMVLGQTTGVAAALAARTGTTPKALAAKKVQKELIKQGIVLGDALRLKELGLA